jgi:hypothetical protein
MKKNAGFYLLIIIVLTVIAGFFVYPKGFGERFRPWKLGLDLVGGTHLVYEVDTSKISSGDEQSVLAGLRDVIERRVNIFGVAEPQVYVAKSGDKTNLVVDLAGVKNVREAIALIGETPQLDFREVEQNGSSTDFVRTNLNGEYVKGASLAFDPTTGAPQVAITFSDAGGQDHGGLAQARPHDEACVGFLQKPLDAVGLIRVGFVFHRRLFLCSNTHRCRQEWYAQGVRFSTLSVNSLALSTESHAATKCPISSSSSNSCCCSLVGNSPGLLNSMWQLIPPGPM